MMNIANSTQTLNDSSEFNANAATAFISEGTISAFSLLLAFSLPALVVYLGTF